MTPQEQEMIDGLISRIRNTTVENKDTAAEQHLQQGLAGYPDAIYVLAQTVLVQQYGLQQAQTQMDALKQQNQDLQDQLQQGQQAQKSSGGGFLSHIFGGGGSNQPSTQQQAAPYQPVNNPGYAGQPYPAGGYPPPPPAYYPPPTSGGGFGGGGFLAGALQTAAGVAAGEAMFAGMESLFHGFGHGGGGYGYGGGFSGGSGGETIVNNYYDEDRNRDRGDLGHSDSSFYNPSDDASRQGAGDNSPQFADTSRQDFQDSGSGDNSGFDESSDDNSSFDDNSDGDDSSSFDDSSDSGGM